MQAYFQYDAIATAVIVFLALCGAIVLVAQAVKIIGGFFKPRHDIDEHFDHVDQCLKNDDQRIDLLQENDKMILRALNQLITHELEGNHVDKLRKVRDEIVEYLIEEG